MTEAEERSRGAALLSVLVLVAALSVAALITTTAIASQTAAAKALRARSQANWATYSAEAVALHALSVLQRQPQGLQAVISMTEPDQAMTVPIQGGRISLQFADGNNCLNINALGKSGEARDRMAEAAWTSLLEEVGIDRSEAVRLTQSLSDWIDADSLPRPQGAEDDYYLYLNPPYRTAGQAMTSPRELASVAGYSRSLRHQLANLSCTRPADEPTQLNINSLRPEQGILLRLLYADTLTVAAAERILASRPAEGWTSVAEFESLPELSMIAPALRRNEYLTTRTTWFRAHGIIELDAGRQPFEFMIHNPGGARAYTIWRRTGED